MSCVVWPTLPRLATQFDLVLRGPGLESRQVCWPRSWVPNYDDDRLIAPMQSTKLGGICNGKFVGVWPFSGQDDFRCFPSQ